MKEIITPIQSKGHPLAILKKGREQSLSRYHLWIFSRAIAQITPEPQEGDLVDVVDSKGKFLATGSWEGGNIAIRVLSFETPIVDEKEFFENKIRAALRLRQKLHLPFSETDSKAPNNIYRLVYGEGDGLSGLIVDIYGHTAVIQAHSMGIFRRISLIKEVLLECRELELQAIYDKSSSTLQKEISEFYSDGYLYGDAIREPLYERGLRFLTDIEKGQKTGFFIDQRDNRELVEKYANGRNVLNCFCYTGGFSAYAIRGGACSVDSLDSSARALDVAKEVIALNFPELEEHRHQVVNADAFDYLNNLQGGEYDLIVLDPPAFAKRKDNVRNACNGYRKLNALALKKIRSGGFLFTFSCSQLVSPYDFRMAVLTASVEAKRQVRILRPLFQAPCHPVNIFHPETEYLKGLLLYVE